MLSILTLTIQNPQLPGCQLALILVTFLSLEWSTACFYGCGQRLQLFFFEVNGGLDRMSIYCRGNSMYAHSMGKQAFVVAIPSTCHNDLKMLLI